MAETLSCSQAEGERERGRKREGEKEREREVEGMKDIYVMYVWAHEWARGASTIGKEGAWKASPRRSLVLREAERRERIETGGTESATIAARLREYTSNTAAPENYEERLSFSRFIRVYRVYVRPRQAGRQAGRRRVT